MRKYLLLSLVALLTSVSAFADVAAFIPTGSSAYKGAATGDKKVTMPAGNIFATGQTMSTVFTIPDVVSFQWEKKNNSTAQVTSGTLRWYQGDILTVTPAANVIINKISIKSNDSSYLGNGSTTSWGKVTIPTSYQNPIEWTPGEGAQPENFTITSGKQIRAQYFEIEYTVSGGGEVVVTAPVITLLANNTVEITQEDGDNIYYTIDGTEPTTASTPYTETFTIFGRTTVKAVAANNDNELSRVVTKELVPNVVTSIAEFLSYTPTEQTTINAPLTAIYKNGRYLYIKDAADSYTLAYNADDVADITALEVTNGDQFASITGTYGVSGGLPEIIPSAIGAKTAGTAVAPAAVEITSLDASMYNHYVTFGPVSIVAQTKANNYTATDAAGNEITIYNPFYNAAFYDVVEVPEGEGFTVTGFVGVYNGTIQITPVAFAGGTAKVETPVFSIASGSVDEGTTVEISCATEGATIYYTIDETDPSAANGTEYTPAGISITNAVTIKAIAVKANMLDSDIATAEYTITPADQQTATFMFTSAAAGNNLNPAIEYPTADNKSISLADRTFTNGAVSVAFAAGTNTSNNPVFFYPTGSLEGQIEARIYTNNTITISAQEAMITSVAFEQWTNSTSWGGFSTTTEGATVTGKEVTSAGVSEIILTCTGTSRFKSITVKYNPNAGAIEDVIEDADADAPVEFFNLQGVKIGSDNLTPGIYIRRQGSKVTKVLVM